MERIRLSGAKGIAPVIMMSLVLAGCGAGGGDDDPTPTAEAVDAQPTVEGDATPGDVSFVGEGTAVVPENIDLSTAGGVGTPVENEGTEDGTPESGAAVAPDHDTVGSSTPAASPDAVSNTVDSSTPVSTGGSSEESATPESSSDDVNAGASESNDVVIAGDGTTGATPGSVDGDTGDEGSDEPVEEESATPGVGTAVASAEPVVVDNCAPDAVPTFAGGVSIFVLAADLNFRTGPGSDCDVIGTGPLGEFSQVEVTSGPVIREGEDDIEWVQIQVGDETGWVASEFLEPAE